MNKKTFKELMTSITEARKNVKVTSVMPIGTSSLINMDFTSLYPSSSVVYHFGGNSKRIAKARRIIKNIGDDRY